MTTIRQIAQKAGVSKSTVGLALNRDSRCSKDTIEKVARVAEEMGYRPNPLVKANMANMRIGARRKNIQSILAYFYDYSKGSPYKLRSFKGASKRAEELGFALEPFPYNDPDMNPKRLLDILKNRNVQGILIGEHTVPIPRIDFKWDSFVVVGIGYTLKDPQIDRIGYDHIENMHQLFRDLQQRGYQRLGLALRSDFAARPTHLPLANFLKHQFGHPLSGSMQVLIESENWNRATFIKWFRSNNPDCIITVGNDVAKWLASSKIRYPEDVGLFSIWHQDKEECASSYFEVNVEQLASSAIDVISEKLNINSRGVPQQRRSILIAGKFVDKHSLRAVD